MRAFSAASICSVLAVLALGTACSGEDVSPEPTSSPTATTSESPTDGVTEQTTTVSVYFAKSPEGDPCEDVFPVLRDVPQSSVLTSTMEALLAGPTEEERAAGYDGWFSSETAGMLDEAQLFDDRAVVSFDAALPQTISNASTSCGSMLLFAQLDSTLLALDGVDEVRYSLEGDFQGFYGWLQRSVPGT